MYIDESGSIGPDSMYDEDEERIINGEKSVQIKLDTFFLSEEELAGVIPRGKFVVGVKVKGWIEVYDNRILDFVEERLEDILVEAKKKYGEKNIVLFEG